MQTRQVMLSDCLGWLAQTEAFDVVVSGITLDSRAVNDGDLFIAVKGLVVDGRAFIEQAFSHGARVCFRQAESRGVQRLEQCWIIDVPKLDELLSEIASCFFDKPSNKMSVIGVTGTNGKTTVSQLLGQAFFHEGRVASVIGTAGNGVWPQLETSTHTTPDAVSLQRLFYEFELLNSDIVAMEVSSHGLDQGRVREIDFDVAVFTNLTRDHLDYHGSMEAYSDAKALLFQGPNLKTSVINLDDEFGVELLSKACGNTVSFSITNPSADVYCKKYSLSKAGVTLDVSTPWGEASLSSPLIGRFNISNLLAVISVLGSFEISLDVISELTPKLESVAGRMELLGYGHTPTVIVDYAHTGDALEKALLAVKEHCHGKVTCVFGCGGDRDTGKRSEMGRIAERIADSVVVTNDNPRTEDADKIIEDITSGLVSPELVLVEKNREEAIRLAVHAAGPDDWVVVAGKGHEDYQDVNGIKYPFSDIEKSNLALSEYPVNEIE